MLVLLHAGLAFAEGDSHLKALVELAPEYKGFRIQTLPQPVPIQNVSLQVITKVDRFVQIIEGHHWSGSLLQLHVAARRHKMAARSTKECFVMVR